jgi:glyoxylase-like metal-dependent hydrolase (beta-lactamase superfamily II)
VQLTVSDGAALGARVDALGKPLRGVVITHAHPDHYGGLAELVRELDVPVVATAGVAQVIRRDDPVKEQIPRPMFGDEWARERAFPDGLARDGETLTFGDIALQVTDLGPGESPHDSVWALAGEPATVFSGDVAYDRCHCYLADGHHAEWLANIDRLRRELPAGAVDAIGRADWTDPEQARADVVATMLDLLPSDVLRFLMELSIDPLAAALGAPMPNRTPGDRARAPTTCAAAASSRTTS